MRRLLRRVLVLAVLALVAAVPGVAAHWSLPTEEVPEPTRITRYQADLTVDAQGGMDVVERIAVAFPGGRHGIFRFFDLEDPNAPELRRLPREVSVTRDGSAEPSVWLRERWGRIVNLRIGSEQVFLTPGEHVYEIRYRVDDVLLPEGDGSRFYWNLIPSGWRQPIHEARLTVSLPERGQDVWCAIGAGTTENNCGEVGRRGDRLIVNATDLEPNTPVTLRADLDGAVPPRQSDEVPWSAAWDPVLGTDADTLAWVLGLALVVGVLGVLATLTVRESRPAFPLMYAPPDGIGPAQGAFVLTETTTDDHFIASLMYAADRGAITLARDGDYWSVGAGDRAVELDPVTAEACRIVHDAPTQTLTVGPKRVAEGAILKQQMASTHRATRNWAIQSWVMSPQLAGCLGVAMVSLSILAAIGLVVLGLAGQGLDLPGNLEQLLFTAVAIVPAAFWLTAAPMTRSGAGTRRTRSGRELWSRVGGFHRMLATPSSLQRFEFSGREELYTAYIPWAVAFGCADEWADKFHTETGVEPPTPAYLVDHHHPGRGLQDSVGSVSRSFSASVASAVSAYQATQTSSSSSGGSSGSSGGGGGGGGGGGSW